MAVNTMYECSKCGHKEKKWAGKCPKCKAFNTMEEKDFAEPANASLTAKGARAAKVASGRTPQPVTSILKTTSAHKRISTGIGEFDRVLGGGLVPGGVLLLAGNPGAGKSTLATEMAAKVAAQGLNVLYITGEETEQQVAERADRVGGAGSSNLSILSEPNLQNALDQTTAMKPDLLIVDSVQTLMSEESAGSTGSPTQVKEVASDFTSWAKRTNTPTVLIGHVTKEGAIAGPRVVEHLVDVVLFFEVNDDNPLRMLRAVKNRYGTTDELGCFQHTAEGLEEVTDPAGYFTDEHEEGTTGFATSITLEGRRALPIEIQALVTPTRLPNPRKVTQGIEHSRALMLQAVADRYLKLRLFDQDVYAATTGGLVLRDPSTDLAVLVAMLSSARGVAMSSSAVFLGEVSLTGEIRSPRDQRKRIQEAERMGFTQIYTTPTDVSKNVIPIRKVIDLVHLFKVKASEDDD